MSHVVRSFVDNSNSVYVFSVGHNTNVVHHKAFVDGSMLVTNSLGVPFLVLTNGDAYQITEIVDFNTIVVRNVFDGETFTVTSPNCGVLCVIVISVIVIGGIAYLGYKLYKCGERIISNWNNRLSNASQLVANCTACPPDPTNGPGSVGALMFPATCTLVVSNSDYQQMWQDVRGGWVPPVPVNWNGDLIDHQYAVAIGPKDIYMVMPDSSAVQTVIMTSTNSDTGWVEETEPFVSVVTVGVDINGNPSSQTTISFFMNEPYGTNFAILNQDESVNFIRYQNESFPPAACRKEKQRFWTPWPVNSKKVLMTQ